MIIFQEFKEISWNILKKLKQLLKKFYLSFVHVKCMKILIKTYFLFPLLSKLLRKFWDNLEGLLQNFDETLEKFKEDSKQCKLSKTRRNSGKNEKKLTRFYRNTSTITHSLPVQFFDTSTGILWQYRITNPDPQLLDPMDHGSRIWEIWKAFGITDPFRGSKRFRILESFLFFTDPAHSWYMFKRW